MLNQLKALFYKLTASAVFILEIKKGKIIIRSGDVPTGFVTNCRELVFKQGLSKGMIIGKKGTHNRISLKFSRDVPESLHQQLRNIWGLYG